MFTTKKCCQNLEAETRSSFHLEKKIAPVFKGMEIVVGIFPRSQQYFVSVRQLYQYRQPYIG